MTIKLTPPLKEEEVVKLRAGDEVLISGKIYTARDAAHQLLVEAIKEGRELPFNLEGSVIFYAGPAPAKPGAPIGSVGPTTSYRMDSYTPALLEKGLKAAIGKGNRSQAVKDALVKHKAVYLAAIGGVAALLAKTVKASRPVAFPELGPEAVVELEVENFPAIVINDVEGRDLYLEGQEKYQKRN